MIKAPDIPTIINPQLIDLALLELQSRLMVELPWLNHAFGKSQPITTMKGNREIKHPSVYIGGEDYLNVFPDSHIGNFIFFDTDGDQSTEQNGRQITKHTSKVGLIIWFDFRTVYTDDWERRTPEHVKKQVLDVLYTSTLKKSRITLSGIKDRASDIYKGYTNTEIDNQYLMRPFGGFRVNFDFEYWHENYC